MHGNSDVLLVFGGEAMKEGNDGMYTDALVYSPHVVAIRDADERLTPAPLSLAAAQSLSTGAMSAIRSLDADSPYSASGSGGAEGGALSGEGSRDRHERRLRSASRRRRAEGESPGGGSARTRLVGAPNWAPRVAFQSLSGKFRQARRVGQRIGSLPIKLVKQGSGSTYGAGGAPPSR